MTLDPAQTQPVRIPPIIGFSEFERAAVAMMTDAAPARNHWQDQELKPSGRGETGAQPIAMQWHGDADPHAERPWLIQDLLFEVGAGLESGQWGSGKTFGALDLSACVMTGEPFAGKRVVRQGGVLFIAAEGASEIPIRLRGLVEGKLRACRAGEDTTAPEIDVDRLPIAWIEECPPLIASESLDRLIATAQVAARHMRERFDLPLALIIVDTLAAASGVSSENDSAEGQKVMNALRDLSKATGAFALAIDHFGKVAQTGTRGSSAKEAAADTVLAMLADRSIEGTVSNTRMAVRKVRGARSGYEVPYRLETVTLGENRFGDPITTCIVEWDASRPANAATAAKRDRWTKTLRIFRRALEDALEAHGIRAWPYGAGEPEQKAAPYDRVRAAFYAAYPADGDEAKRADAKRKALQRAVRQANESGLIGSVELSGVDHLWIKPE